MVHIDQNDKFDKLFESTMGLGNAINNFSNEVKSGINNFLKKFKPTYSVNAVTYFVIPGAPLKKNVNAYHFGKGELSEAKLFFDQVFKKTKELSFAPVELQLIQGKKKLIDEQKLGPVDIVKSTIQHSY